MNRPLVLAEWQRARLSLLGAQLLTRNGVYPDAVSRAYYAVLHAAKAALQTQDIGAASHSAVKRLFGLHLVKTGQIEPEWSADLVESLDDRLAADYDAELRITQREAREKYRRAVAFVKRVRKYLLAQGLSRAELEK
ncbi:MAG: HEPN domain-containing protein [Betaproteobacteria bacterium]|nr:HEPN domain-containing protein [Betaproteobacteria bacterium]MBI3937287.1 HEPN domain-containing protein [Betaproteobacteria bacterium]